MADSDYMKPADYQHIQKLLGVHGDKSLSGLQRRLLQVPPSANDAPETFSPPVENNGNAWSIYEKLKQNLLQNNPSLRDGLYDTKYDNIPMITMDSGYNDNNYVSPAEEEAFNKKQSAILEQNPALEPLLNLATTEDDLDRISNLTPSEAKYYINSQKNRLSKKFINSTPENIKSTYKLIIDSK